MLIGASEFTDRRTYALETMSGPLSAPWPLSLEVGECWNAYLYLTDPCYRYPRDSKAVPDLTVRVYWEYGEQSLLRHELGLDYQIVILVSRKDVALLERVLHPSLSRAEMLAKESPEAYRSLFAIALLEAAHRKGWRVSSMYVYQDEPFRETGE